MKRAVWISIVLLLLSAAACVDGPTAPPPATSCKTFPVVPVSATAGADTLWVTICVTA